MKKYDKLTEAHAAAVERKKAMQEEIKRLDADHERLAEEADTAAAEGDIPAYREKRDAAQLAADTAFVRRKQLEIFNELQPVEDGRDAWQEIANAHNKAWSKEQEAFKKAQQDFLAAYMALVKRQADTLRCQARIRECVGTEAFANGISVELLPNAFMRNTGVEPDLISTMVLLKVPEYIYFLDREMLTATQARFIHSVVRNREP